MSAKGKGANPNRTDWARVRRRMAEALRAGEQALAPSPARARQILDERARSLAGPPVRESREKDGLQVVAFGVAGTAYLIESRYVREALQAPSVTPVPRTPSYLMGLTNLRGELVPVFALQLYYGSLGTAPSRGAFALVLGETGLEFAIAADWIEPATSLPASAIVGDPSETENHKGHVRGMTADGHILLDGFALLKERDLFLQS